MPPVARPAMRSWRKSAILYPLRRHPGSRRRRLSGTITYTGSSWVPALAPLGRDDSSGRRPLLRSLAELRQFAGDLLLTGDDLGDVADAIDVAFVVQVVSSRMPGSSFGVIVRPCMVLASALRSNLPSFLVTNAAA